MKRLTILLALILALTCLTAAAEPRTGIHLSHDRAVEMAQYMRGLVDGDYLDIKQVPQEMQEIAAKWAAGVNESPRLVVELELSGLAAISQIRAVFRMEPEAVRYEAESTMLASVWQAMVNSASQEGVAALSFAEIQRINAQIQAFRMYAEAGEEGNGMYIVLYENAAPIVMIVNAENGAVSIQGMFLPSEKLAKCQNYGQVALWLMLGGIGMTCSEVKPE